MKATTTTDDAAAPRPGPDGAGSSGARSSSAGPTESAAADPATLGVQAPVNGAKDVSSRLALRAIGLLAEFNRAGVLDAADVHVAQRLAALGGEPDERVQLAVALAVRGVRHGSVALRLADAAHSVVADEGDPDQVVTADLPWPESGQWLRAVQASPLTTVHVGEHAEPAEAAPSGGASRPLRMWDDQVWLDRYWEMERAIAADLLARSEWQPEANTAALDSALSRLWPSPDDADQREAARTCALTPVSVLGGGPGTGKTTTVARLLAALGEIAPDQPPRIGLAAPTGKAAARLKEALSEAATGTTLNDTDRALLAGLESATLHRLIGVYPGRPRVRHHRGNPLPFDVVVLDEASMVPLAMFRHLLDALRPHARLVLVGDPDQLASVDAGAVLADLVGTRNRSAAGRGVSQLVSNRRSGDRPRLTAAAQAIREGDADALLEVMSDGGDEITWHRLDDAKPVPPEALTRVRAHVLSVSRVLVPAARTGDVATALEALGRHRLLCAHRRGPRGVAWWGAQVQRWVADDDPLVAPRRDGRYPGQPLLVTSNDYENGLWNGDSGVVVADDDDLIAAFGRGSQSVRRPLGRLGDVVPMHAMTIHRSQGSEFDSVTVVLPVATSALTTRETLYTALTRARERAVLLGSEEAVRACVSRHALRASGLGRRLVAGLAPAPVADSPPTGNDDGDNDVHRMVNQ